MADGGGSSTPPETSTSSPGATSARDASEADEATTVEPSPLFAWATGTFHTAVLVAALVAGLHLAGAAGDLLGEVGTLPGALAYLYLWIASTWTTGRALQSGGVAPVDGVPDRARALRGALTWGGVTGVLFFAALFVVVAGLLLLNVGLGAAAAVVVIGLLGGLLAAVVGAVVGAVLAAVDLALLHLAVLVTGDLSRGGP